jgi:hypothetical protein
MFKGYQVERPAFQGWTRALERFLLGPLSSFIKWAYDTKINLHMNFKT